MKWISARTLYVRMLERRGLRTSKPSRNFFHISEIIFLGYHRLLSSLPSRIYSYICDNINLVLACISTFYINFSRRIFFIIRVLHLSSIICVIYYLSGGIVYTTCYNSEYLVHLHLFVNYNFHNMYFLVGWDKQIYIYLSLEQFSNILPRELFDKSSLLHLLARNPESSSIPLPKGGKTNYSQFVIPTLRMWDSRFLDNLTRNNLGASGVSLGVRLESRASKCMEIGNLTIRSQ